jgi:hypothetical protein
MYFSAISSRDYARAWDLGGDSTGSSFAAFEAGFDATAQDNAAISAVSGDVVTAQITALQTNGSVKVFQGSYTVSNGVITRFSVRQVS